MEDVETLKKEIARLNKIISENEYYEIIHEFDTKNWYKIENYNEIENYINKDEFQYLSRGVYARDLIGRKHYYKKFKDISPNSLYVTGNTKPYVYSYKEEENYHVASFSSKFLTIDMFSDINHKINASYFTRNELPHLASDIITGYIIKELKNIIDKKIRIVLTYSTIEGQSKKIVPILKLTRITFQTLKKKYKTYFKIENVKDKYKIYHYHFNNIYKRTLNNLSNYVDISLNFDYEIKVKEEPKPKKEISNNSIIYNKVLEEIKEYEDAKTKEERDEKEKIIRKIASDIFRTLNIYVKTDTCNFDMLISYLKKIKSMSLYVTK